MDQKLNNDIMVDKMVNREIKFRTFFLHTKPYMSVIKRGMYEVRRLCTKNGKISSVSIIEKVGDDGSERFHDLIGIITNEKEFEVMQFTGKKDSNGVEIYEGDICSSKYWRKNLVVVFNVAQSAFCLSDGKGDPEENPLCLSVIDPDDECPGLVVGNIYENPELLEATSELYVPKRTRKNNNIL